MLKIRKGAVRDTVVQNAMLSCVQYHSFKLSMPNFLFKLNSSIVYFRMKVKSPDRIFQYCFLCYSWNTFILFSVLNNIHPPFQLQRYRFPFGFYHAPCNVFRNARCQYVQQTNDMQGHLRKKILSTLAGSIIVYMAFILNTRFKSKVLQG